MSSFRTFVGVAALFIALPAAHADDLAELLKRVPGDMNTVAVINVREINKCPRAVKENWKENHETEYLAGAMAVPSWASVVVIGADLHPHALAQSRSVALVPIENTLNSETIARRENGTVQTVGDLTLVLSPRRGYFGFPSSGIIAISNSMPRQDFARWVRSARKPETPGISKYLQDAVAANKNSHIVVAMDLQDLIDPTSARAGLQRSGVVPKESELDSLVNVLCSARGLILKVQIDDQAKTELRFEFGYTMSDFLPAMQKVWPKAIDAAGLDIPELKSATAKAEGKSVVFTAELADTSLRRLLSIVNAPGDALRADSTGIDTPKEAAALSASLRYYRAVNSALDDLKAQGDAKGKNYVRSAAFFDTYAAKIEKIGLLDVDPALVQYGASATAKMRAMSASLRGVQVQLETYDNYKSTTWVSSGGGFVTPRGRIGYGGGGDVQMSTNVQELNNKQAELVIKLEPERIKLWGVLESDRSTIRREMLDKYKVDFDLYKK